MRKRRQEVFLGEFADAIDIMVRGLKAGLPVSDAMKVIAGESPPPVGPEFLEVVEGQRVGIAIDQGIERMFDRMPLSEVNFLGIVMAIQTKTGGNLAETLANLSDLLRRRRMMVKKTRAMSSEARASTMILGSLPIVVTGILFLTSPSYIKTLFGDPRGMMLIGLAIGMLVTGIGIMVKMAKFEI